MFKDHYDIIISNPPFYENDLRSPNSVKNKAHHDESLLLPELLDIITANLLTTGSFFLLLPYKRNKEVQQLFSKAGLHITRRIFVRPSPAHDPFRVLVRGEVAGSSNNETINEELVIRDQTGQYTGTFISYLGDYYLYL
jgi:tRNA1Val (adenine37-N6)-methyltransferase